MKTIQKRELKKLRIPAIWCFTLSLFLCLNLAAWCQTSTVVIAEVMYDHPLYDNEATKTGHEGEFMSLYNYGEDDVDISGWRIEIVNPATLPQNKYAYRIPSNTVLPESGMVVVASRAANSNFDVLQFYGMEMLEEPEGYFLLYTSSLAFPDTRSRIRLYDAQSNLQDELIYDGNTGILLDTLILRAENKVNPNRPLSKTVSIQRERLVEEEGKRIISRADYFAPDPERTVQLFNYIPEDYSYTAPPSLLSAGVPDDLTLTGTATGTNDHRTKTITSNQVIASGKTDYWAEEEIVLEPGFEVKEGAEFIAGVERDSVHLVKMMTYNLKGKHTEYKKHAHVVKYANPDVVAVQEVRGLHKFKILKDSSGYKGKRFCVIGDYGIGMLWNKAVVGDPIAIKKRLVSVINWANDTDHFRGFLVIEFRDFCFISTHLSLDKATRKRMANLILGNKIVKDCVNKKKPVYIAGDMNEQADESAIMILKNNGYKVLNNIDDPTHSTRVTRSHIDLILEYNMNPHHKTIDRYPLVPEEKRHQWFYIDKISDHIPYLVKVKIK